MLRTAILMLMILTMSVADSLADDYLIRIDSLELTRVIDDSEANRPRPEELDLSKEQDTAKESIEVKVKCGERFYGRSINGDRLFEIRGQLKPSDQPQCVILEITVVEATRTEPWGPNQGWDERTTGRRYQSTIILKLRESLRLSAMTSVSNSGSNHRFRCDEFRAIVDRVPDLTR